MNSPRLNRLSRAVAVFVVVLALVVVSAGVGGRVALTVQRHHHAANARETASTQAIAAPQPVEKVAATVLPSVVDLKTRVGDAIQDGSGIILSSNGLILTNDHVVRLPAGIPGGPAQTLVTFHNGRTASFTVVGADPTTDIAVVRAKGVSGLTPLTLGSSDNLRVGQQVVAVGSPLGLEGTVTSGIISAINRPVHVDSGGDNLSFDAIQTDAAINPGNSGGPLVDMKGQVIAVDSAIASLGTDAPDAESGSIGVGFAIPVDQAKRVADQLVATGHATHASLGAEVATDPSIDGARIVSITPDGAAAAAGIPVGAVVTKVDNQVIGDGDALVAAVRSRAPDDDITVTYADPSGASHTAHVKLGSDRAL
jgi:putative serine protease PepD